ncbi:NAD(P)/FAD-dependent oxidoreductase, partial [Xanthomonas citri pv. citri]|nr:NAD(P)/FAD-dependent oxidoreductase [Xanthomonas citri pv. citri]
SGGIRFVASQRHAVYIEAHAFKRYLHQLRRRLGWGELGEHMYDALKLDAGGDPRMGTTATARLADSEVAHG